MNLGMPEEEDESRGRESRTAILYGTNHNMTQ
jgi:hypothetical protein